MPLNKMPIMQNTISSLSDAFLVILRHGQSEYNLKNLFTGWIDCSLSEKGKAEAKKAGKIFHRNHLLFDIVYCSELKRTVETYEIIAAEYNEYQRADFRKSKEINERNYGQLQGKNKDEVAREFGEEQAHIWRRSYDVAPPGGESLKDTEVRVVHFLETIIKPLLQQGKKILIIAHGNSLRALMRYLENIPVEKIQHVEIATGQSILYRFNEDFTIKQKEILQ